jgi:HD-like signal output (HDOD) protein/ActR/RegA family two-component response regulator
MPSSRVLLFVDDEPRILSGLRRMLRSMRHEWETAFAASGREALDYLSGHPADVIVSDIRMPGMNGVELLDEVRKRYPHVARIALSGQASKETVLHSVGLVHQYLAKPCEAETLKATVGRVGRLHDLVADVGLRRRLSALVSLPAAPQLHRRLVEEAQSPQVSINEMAHTISQDLAMSARVLQLVSSAFFGRPTEVPDATRAGVFLGLDVVKSLVLSARAFFPFEPPGADGAAFESLRRHGLTVSACAKAIAAAEHADQSLTAHACVAGLLHDVGKLFLAVEGADDGREAAQHAPDAPAPAGAERSDAPASHAEVGAYLMGLWGLHDPVVEAVAFHHHPRRNGNDRLDTLAIVHAADAAVRECTGEATANEPAEIDEAYLAELGLADRVPAWRDLCRPIVEKEMAGV